MKYSQKYGTDKVRVLTLAKNRGKGGAVRMVNLYLIPEKRQKMQLDVGNEPTL